MVDTTQIVPYLSSMQVKHHTCLFHYRTDIDGLRAVAVLSVVLFHLGIYEIPGGFVGVDIFFVISGYLISRIIFSDILGRTFSILRFYEHRARRIFPAFFAVSFLTTFTAYRLFYPQDLIGFAHSLFAAALFGVNIFFFATSNYFSPAATRLPLLHYWSLGVEEQYYFLFPAIILVIQRLRAAALQPVIIVGFVFSLLASGLLTQAHPTAAFYLLPFRAFEFLIGSILAFPSLRVPKDVRIASAISVLGLALLAGSIFCFQNTMIYPGFAAVVPCLGTAFVLWGGSGVRTLVYKTFSIWPLRAVGKISYSLYLVHWPIIVFGIQLTQEMNPIVRNTLLFLLSIAAASVSYFLIEQPFRKIRISSKSWASKSWVFGLSSFFIVATMSVAVVIIDKKGFPNRYDAQVSRVSAVTAYRWEVPFRLGQCFISLKYTNADFDVPKCLPVDGKMHVVLWGDSMAADLYSGISIVSKSYGFSTGQVTYGGCPPIYDASVTNPPPNSCFAFNRMAIADIIKYRPNLVILSARWYLIFEDSKHDPNLELFQQEVRILQNANIPVIIVGQQPVYVTDVPFIIANRMRNKGETDGRVIPAAASSEKIMAAIARENNIPYISILNTICVGRECPLTTPEGFPMEFDVDHLTAEGSLLVATRIASDLFERSKPLQK
jgi:peptidoglycan/LPS O-acetylase OafA/YrhL